MSLFDEVSPDLQEEFIFQLGLIRDLREKYKIQTDAFELYAFKMLTVFKELLFKNLISEVDLTASLGFFMETDEMFKDFEVSINELENEKGK